MIGKPITPQELLKLDTTLFNALVAVLIAKGVATAAEIADQVERVASVGSKEDDLSRQLAFLMAAALRKGSPSPPDLTVIEGGLSD